ncbi:MAG: hypothetical protein ABIJ97_18325 [Bacteroidota bacterium]
MKKLLLSLFISLISLMAYSQDIKFKFVEEKGDQKVVIFSIVGITDNSHANQIVEFLESYDEIISCKIFYNKRCKLIVQSSVDTEDATICRRLLQKQNVDFDVDYIIAETKALYLELSDKKNIFPDLYKPNPIPSNEWVYPSSFPKYTDSGDAETDSRNYAASKQQWIEDHPDEYKSMTGVEYLDLINKK